MTTTERTLFAHKITPPAGQVGVMTHFWTTGSPDDMVCTAVTACRCGYLNAINALRTSFVFVRVKSSSGIMLTARKRPALSLRHPWLQV